MSQLPGKRPGCGDGKGVKTDPLKAWGFRGNRNKQPLVAIRFLQLTGQLSNGPNKLAGFSEAPPKRGELPHPILRAKTIKRHCKENNW